MELYKFKLQYTISEMNQGEWIYWIQLSPFGLRCKAIPQTRVPENHWRPWSKDQNNIALFSITEKKKRAQENKITSSTQGIRELAFFLPPNYR